MNQAPLCYDKLLRVRKVSNKYRVIVRTVAKNAKGKIEGAGGEVIVH